MAIIVLIVAKDIIMSDNRRLIANVFTLLLVSCTSLRLGSESPLSEGRDFKISFLPSDSTMKDTISKVILLGSIDSIAASWSHHPSPFSPPSSITLDVDRGASLSILILGSSNMLSGKIEIKNVSRKGMIILDRSRILSSYHGDQLYKCLVVDDSYKILQIIILR